MHRPKQSIVTFKADDSLMEILRGVPNRSSFIRSAILSAIENTCPLCQGTGIMSPEQRTHWEMFAADHRVQECDECHERHLVCSHGTGKSGQRGGRAASHRQKECRR